MPVQDPASGSPSPILRGSSVHPLFQCPRGSARSHAHGGSAIHLFLQAPQPPSSCAKSMHSHTCALAGDTCALHDWTHATGARPAALAAGPHTSRQGSPVPHTCRAGQAEPRQLSQTRRLQGCRHGRGRAAAPASAGSGRARSRTSCCAPAAPASACTRPCWGGRPAAGTPPAVSLPAVGGAAPAPQSQTGLADSPVFRPAL